MKRIILSIAMLVSTFIALAQAPDGVKYQAVVRDGSNLIVANQPVGVQLRILQGTVGGTAVYTETFTPTTNAYGLVNLEIGSGTSTDNFSTIDWENGPYFIETSIDVNGGIAYTVMGTSQLLSVPYALYARTAESALTAVIDNVDDADADPLNELQSLSTNADTLFISDGNYVLMEADSDWTISGDNQYSAVSGNVGIGSNAPMNKLDVNGKISITESGVGNSMVLLNGPVWEHGSGPQTFGNGGSYFMIGSYESSYESAGIYGDGDAVTIWAPGDGRDGQPAALLYINDEDYYDGVDTNPYNNTAIKAYLDNAGNWVAASDRNRKENIVELEGVLQRLMQINGYSYNFKLAPVEIEKGNKTVTTYGVIAQEVIKAFPEIVDVAADGSHYVCYTELIPILIESIQEQQELIKTLQQENTALKARMDNLEERLNAAGL